MQIMNRIYLVLLCLALSSCGGSSVSKPARLTNAEIYTEEAVNAYEDEEWSRAQQLFNQSLTIYQGIDDRTGVLVSHINLVEVALARHDLQSAQKHLIVAEDIVKTEGIGAYQARITLLYALVAIQQDEMTKGNGFLQQLMPEFKGGELVDGIDAIQLAAIASRTELAFTQKQDESLWVLRFANALKKAVNEKMTLKARLLRFQSLLLIQQADYSRAEELLQQALLIVKNNLSRSGIAQVLFELGQLKAKQGTSVQALNYFDRSIAVFRSVGNDVKVNKVKVERAKLAVMP